MNEVDRRIRNRSKNETSDARKLNLPRATPNPDSGDRPPSGVNGYRRFIISAALCAPVRRRTPTFADPTGNTRQEVDTPLCDDPRRPKPIIRLALPTGLEPVFSPWEGDVLGR